MNEYARQTLLYHTSGEDDLQIAVMQTMDELGEMKLIEIKDHEYKATLLGEAIVAASLTPEDGLFVHKELKKSLGAFVLDSDMHAL